MSVIDGDTIDTFGGAFENASNVINSLTDMDAGQSNAAMAAVSAMTQTRTAAWVRMTMGGGAAPTLVAWRALWRNALPQLAAPVLAYSGTVGHFTVTWPATVYDELALGQAGYTGPQGLLLLGGWSNPRVASGGTLVIPVVSIQSGTPNAADVVFFGSGFTQVNPTGVDVDVYFL